MVRVTAVTHDGGYRASVIVNVISTKALGADVYAVGADGTEYAAEESSAEDADYELTLPLGSYVFETYAQPASVTVDAGYSASPYGEYGTEGGFTVHAVSGPRGGETVRQIYADGEYVACRGRLRDRACAGHRDRRRIHG